VCAAFMMLLTISFACHCIETTDYLFARLICCVPLQEL
jgi:hypothetical protein